MARVGVTLLCIVGLLLAGAGIIAGLAVGIPALGLNPYGRNPIEATVAGLAYAAMLYGLGAVILVGGTRWLSNHPGPVKIKLDNSVLVPVGLISIGWLGFMATRGDWLGMAPVALTAVLVAAPMVIGWQPWVNRPKDQLPA